MLGNFLCVRELVVIKIKFLFKKRILGKGNRKVKSIEVEINFVWNKIKQKGGECRGREMNQEVVIVMIEKYLLVLIMVREMVRFGYIFQI